MMAAFNEPIWKVTMQSPYVWYQEIGNHKENKDMIYPFGDPSQHLTCCETHGLTKTLEGLAKESPENAQIMKQVAEKAEYERKEHIEKALEGSAELELLKGAQGKRFVLKYFHEGREYTVYGTAYPGYDADQETAKTFKVHTVCLQANSDPIVYNSYSIMSVLQKTLDNGNVPYVIKFFD